MLNKQKNLKRKKNILNKKFKKKYIRKKNIFSGVKLVTG